MQNHECDHCGDNITKKCYCESCFDDQYNEGYKEAEEKNDN
jgi:hypothetical protein